MDIKLGNLYYLVSEKGADQVEAKIKKINSSFKRLGGTGSFGTSLFSGLNSSSNKAVNNVNSVNTEIRQMIDGAQATRNAWQANLIDGTQAKRELGEVRDEALKLREALQNSVL